MTESTADPDKKANSYTLRNPMYHPVNGDEKRILDGKMMDSGKLFFLLDSTPEIHEELGRAYHIFIPYVLIYGYPWSREGEIQVLDGAFLNIRAFAKSYADYSGPHKDNPYVLRVTQLPEEIVEEENTAFMEAAVESFRGIAEEGGGKALRSPGGEDLIKKIDQVLGAAKGSSLDLVLALDTTRSMKNDMPHLRKQIVPLISKHSSRFSHYRLGLLFYRDYFEEYLVKPFPFVTSLEDIQKSIDRVRVAGGRDIPEAVFEALYNSIHYYNWQAESRLIILIGDAPPHPRPRGKVSPEMVYTDAEASGITINTIILPQ
ncbi:MAG: VWA domain-containing protein [Spirochaeta sp.]|nr:VWA domain-containing protein [Spirochaeta sp.]